MENGTMWWCIHGLDLGGEGDMGHEMAFVQVDKGKTDNDGWMDLIPRKESPPYDTP